MSTEIKTITGRCEAYNETNLSSPTYSDSKISVTRFFGGKKNGTMIQLTINNNVGLSYIQLSQKQVSELAKILRDSFNYEKYPSE